MIVSKGNTNYWLQRWANELRSGKYQQCFFAIKRDGNERRAEGVLYQVLIDDGIAYDWESPNRSLTSINQVMSRVGISLVGHIFPVIHMNDAGHPFASIADWIEEQIAPEPRDSPLVREEADTRELVTV